MVLKQVMGLPEPLLLSISISIRRGSKMTELRAKKGKKGRQLIYSEEGVQKLLERKKEIEVVRFCEA